MTKSGILTIRRKDEKRTKKRARMSRNQWANGGGGGGGRGRGELLRRGLSYLFRSTAFMGNPCNYIFVNWERDSVIAYSGFRMKGKRVVAIGSP